MTIHLGFAIAELPGWFATTDDFYGVEITFDANRNPIYRRCGGYEPRPMTEEELEPWLALVKPWVEGSRVLGFAGFRIADWWSFDRVR